ncbi:MAG: UbiD family decarboxylase domain-containing protein, partial [Candidatus Rokuibacteriota bacterium]
MKRDVTSLRSTLDYLEAIGELVTTDVEVDPHLEVAAIQKHFDGGAALLFNKVKGYPNARICNNIFASADRIARLFDVDDARRLKHKVVEALRNPIPPVEVKDGPCQDVVITKDLDVWDRVPMISHSDSDPGRTLGAGQTVVRGKHFWGGSHIGYNRMNFRGADYSSFQISPGSHM